MKFKTILLMVISIIFTLTFSSAQESGLALSVKPGMMINAAHIGYKTGSLFAGFGLEFGSVSVESKTTYKDTVNDSTYVSSSKNDATVFLPQLATKIFFGEASSEGTGAVPYIWLSVFYSVAMTKVTYGGESDTIAAREMRDLLGGNLGGAIAFGGEYNFSSNFSLSGEFGVRLLFGGTKTKYNSYYGERIYEDKLGLGFTYTAMGLNFYF